MYGKVSNLHDKDMGVSKTKHIGTRPVELLKKMDVVGCAGVFGYFAGSAFHILGETSMNSANFLNMTVRQPYGVVGLIIPWNVSE